MKRACALISVLALAAAFPAVANADSYAIESWTTCPVQSLGSNGGGWDQQGRLYIPCGSPANTVRVFDPNGTELAPPSTVNANIRDIAASPNGAHLYIARGGAAPQRLNRQLDGSYAVDATWTLDSYRMWGCCDYVPKGYFLTTDADGFIYVADGGGGNGTHTVVKYQPDGDVVTNFGEKNAGVGCTWDIATFCNLHGIGVTPDGERVYTTDGLNSRVLRWDRDENGDYAVHPTWKIGNDEANDPDRSGGCWLTDQKLASPYEVTLDAEGALYILNTTCDEVLKFEQDMTFIVGYDLGGALPHSFSVSADGRRIYVSESQKRLVRTDGATPASCAEAVTSSPGVTLQNGVLTGTPGNDVIVGTAGADQVAAGAGNDLLCGRAGYDTLAGEGGDDQVDGGPVGEADVVDYRSSVNAVTVDLASTQAQPTGNGSDTLLRIEDVLGSNSAQGDRLDGTGANNFFGGGAGPDRIYGRGGNDLLRGHAGDDVLIGGAGADKHWGDAGRDTASYAGSPTSVTVTLSDTTANDGIAGEGDNANFDGLVERVTGGNASDSLTGSSTANRLIGGPGRDVLKGLGGSDVLEARDDLDDSVLTCGSGAADRLVADLSPLDDLMASAACETVDRG